MHDPWKIDLLPFKLYRFYLDPLNLHHVFLYISLLLLHDYNVKKKNNDFVFLFVNFDTIF